VIVIDHCPACGFRGDLPDGEEPGKSLMRICTTADCRVWSFWLNEPGFRYG